MSGSGRLFRRCGCRDDDGRQAGTRCPNLTANRKHGTWCFRIDLPTQGGKRRPMERGGYTRKADAERALTDVINRRDGGIAINDRETVDIFLAEWLDGRRHSLKPKTWHSYSEYVHKTIIPALGTVRLEALRHGHVVQLVNDLEAAGKGPATIHRVVATLRSALSTAVAQRRLPHNPAAQVEMPPERPVEREPWSVAQAVTFLDYVTGDPLAEVFETMICTGLRRGETLALRWSFIDLDRRLLRIDPRRGNLSDVNGRLMFTAPKTKGSAAVVGLSRRVVAALARQRARQDLDRAEWAEAYTDDDLVFARPDGAPLRPEKVLRRFRALSAAAGLPECTLHDLRHLAVTVALADGVPLAMVSKFARHATTAMTGDRYGHLAPDVSTAVADSIGGVLDAAAAELAAERALRAVRTTDAHDHDREGADT